MVTAKSGKRKTPASERPKRLPDRKADQSPLLEGRGHRNIIRTRTLKGRQRTLHFGTVPSSPKPPSIHNRLGSADWNTLRTSTIKLYPRVLKIEKYIFKTLGKTLGNGNPRLRHPRNSKLFKTIKRPLVMITPSLNIQIAL